MKEPLHAFKAARLFSPAKVQQIKPTLSSLDTLSVFPFLSAQIPTLMEEFPLYMATSEDIDPTYDLLRFWKQQEQSLPAWSQAARQVILIQPSSAASERVFFSATKLLWGEAKLLPPRLHGGINYDAIQQSLIQHSCTVVVSSDICTILVCMHNAHHFGLVITVCFDKPNRNNERIIGQMCWNNRDNYEEIWNSNFFGIIGSALMLFETNR